MGRFTKIVAGVFGMTLLLSGCAMDSLGDPVDASPEPGQENTLGTITAGVLTVCSEIPFEPFEYEDPADPEKYTGFDIDIVGEIATRLGLELVVVDSDFDALQSGLSLATDKCDLGASAMTITEDRRANIDFTDAYYDSLQSLLVAKDSGITSLDDLAGKSIGVQKGTTGEIYAEQNQPEGAQIVGYPSDGELWPALQAGQIQAILQDQPVNVIHARTDAAYVVVAEYQTDESYGMALAKDKNPELLAAVNGALAEMRADGTYKQIYDKYFA
ncbi:MAG: ABC transporter substrate-binding protein [Propionibacteriaceae bacterium]|nr:ABC transporter substrate-binding protein [Propionibacteriaceae bacterium]